MYLYKIEQTVVTGYDTYSEAVVVCSSEDEAREVYPGSLDGKFPDWIDKDCISEWPIDSDDVKVTFLGEYSGWGEEDVVICSSYHAG